MVAAIIMKQLALALYLACAALVPALAGSPDTLDPQLEPLRPFLGKTWKGEFQDSTPEKPKADVARWERAMNGKAVRVLHSVNEGAYGGESIVIWDKEKQSLVSYYFTTAGFMTIGTITVKDGKVTTLEKVSGSPGGITEVRGTTTLPSDGKFHLKTEYLKDGAWTPGREMTYKEDAAAKVVFQ